MKQQTLQLLHTYKAGMVNRATKEINSKGYSYYILGTVNHATEEINSKDNGRSQKGILIGLLDIHTYLKMS